MAAVRIVPMTEPYAADIAAWRYPPPYDCYDMTEVDPGFLVNPENGFFALTGDDDALIGFRSFGPDGQVPGGSYDSSALDTGGGLRPDLTGQGLGRRAITVRPGIRTPAIAPGRVPGHRRRVQCAGIARRGGAGIQRHRPVRGNYRRA